MYKVTVEGALETTKMNETRSLLFRSLQSGEKEVVSHAYEKLS